MKVLASLVVICCALSPAFSLSYLESLVSPPASIGGGGPSGGIGMTSGASYLDALKSDASSAPQGGGMAGYLDGMRSSAESIPEPLPPVESSFAPATSSVSVGGTSGPSMPSLGSYLDGLPRNAAVTGGPGITSHTDTLPAVNVASGGHGISTYTDALGGTVSSTKSSSQDPSNIRSTSGSTFTLEAEGLGQLMKQLKDATIGKINFSGTFDKITFN